MKTMSRCVLACATAMLLNVTGAAARAAISGAEQQALQTQYTSKVLFFRKIYRMLSRLELSAQGEVRGKYQPGLWTMDGAVQVKELKFNKRNVTFKCAKLWSNLADDGRLRFFPVSVALKGKTDYPEDVEVIFQTKDEDSAEQLVQRVNQVFLGEGESPMSGAPSPIIAYVNKHPIIADYDPEASAAFDGTPPRVISRTTPDLSREALLAGQAGQEKFVVLVDEQGKGAVVAFTRLLQYGLEETTIEALKNWKFAPAMRDGKPVAVRMALSIDYKRPTPQ